MTFEIIFSKCKWLVSCIYKPPNIKPDRFSEIFTSLADKCFTKFDNCMFIGDMNFDLLSDTKGKPLCDIIDLLDLVNLIKEPTCFMKNMQPSLVDVILTNRNKLCMKTLNFSTGVSDCHNFISTVVNNNVPKTEKQKVSYRSFRKLNVDDYVTYLKDIKIVENDDLNAMYNNFENEISSVIDKHVPLKQMYKRNAPLPCMNRKLRKAIYQKKMMYHKYLKNKNSKTWNKYRIARNAVTSLKKKSLNKYFQERCIGGCKTSDF